MSRFWLRLLLYFPCFQKIVIRKNISGLYFIFHEKLSSLFSLTPKKNALFLILDKIEKPGNLGAILRSAEASNVDAIIITDPLVDFFNPNVIRASLGASFCVPLVKASKENCLKYFKEKKISIYSTSLTKDAKLYYNIDCKKSLAFVFGSEAFGICDFWKLHAKKEVIIPMGGKIDSLNVSVAAGILLFETMRQRNV